MPNTTGRWLCSDTIADNFAPLIDKRYPTTYRCSKNILVIIPAEIPDDLKIVKIGLARLPKAWNSYPAPGVLQDIGDDWLSKKQSAVLCVPSAIITTVNNYLLNPLHEDFSKINIKRKEITPFIFDNRLL